MINSDPLDELIDAIDLGAGVAARRLREELAMLPPLPEGRTVMQLADEFGSGSIAYSPTAVRQAQREAVEVYRATRAPIEDAQREKIQRLENDRIYLQHLIAKVLNKWWPFVSVTASTSELRKLLLAAIKPKETR